MAAGLAGLALLCILAALPAGGAAAPRPLVYVALGDSIARGWGLDGPVPGAKHDSCGNVLPLPAPPVDISRWDAPGRAYPARLARLIAERTGSPVALDNRACSGETTAELLGRDAERLRDAVARRPDIVTLDLGADDVIWSCGLWRAAWKFVVGLAVPVEVTPGLLRDARTVRSQLLGDCPAAKVAAGLASVGRNLPRILGLLVARTRAQVFVAEYYSATGSRTDLAVERRLNAAIRTAVLAAGPRVHLVAGVEAAFAPHDCRATARATWMLVWDICLHPNGTGQQALAQLFADEIARYR